ncbi:MAG: FAD-dependent oxidoreductase [Clostridia bacterium]|nr:FAD-dependent oxidoreductase [Clostridia bacterium]
MKLSVLKNQSAVACPCSVRFDDTYDVIVCGLGTAGSVAAALLAEKGYRVLGLEAFNCVGGTASAGGIEIHYFGLPGGRGHALAAEADRKAAELPMPLAEGRRITLENMLLERGVDISYDSAATGVYMEGLRVCGVRAITKDGVRAYGCRMLFDCTAEGHVARMAGCRGYFGRTADGLAQPFTAVVAMTFGGNVGYINLDAGRTDPRDAAAFSADIIRARATERPEYGWSQRVLRHMPLPGVREGWRLAAAEMLSAEELFAGKVTAEPGYYSYSDIDKHGEDVAFESELRGDWKVGANVGAWNFSQPVPWKVILPEQVDGLAVVCRAVGVDREMASSVRMLPDMYKLAEVAAEATDIALSGEISLREVPYARLSARLTASGCLDPAHNRGVWIDGKSDCDRKPLQPRRVEWICDPEALEKPLSTLCPGLAIWSARRMGESCHAALRRLLAAEDENTRKHAAFALASAGSRESIPQLRDMVVQRDAVMLRDCRKYNQHRGPMAIYHLGRLADAGSVELLGEILTSPAEAEREIYAPCDRYPAVRGFRVLYFHFMSQSVAALVRIGNAHAGLRPRIAEIFRTAFADGTYVTRLTNRPPHSAEGGYAANLRRIADAAAGEWERNREFAF